MNRLALLLFILVGLLCYVLGWSTERCVRVGWMECAKWPVSEIRWSGK